MTWRHAPCHRAIPSFDGFREISRFALGGAWRSAARVGCPFRKMRRERRRTGPGIHGRTFRVPTTRRCPHIGDCRYGCCQVLAWNRARRSSQASFLPSDAVVCPDSCRFAGVATLWPALGISPHGVQRAGRDWVFIRVMSFTVSASFRPR